MPFMPPRSLVLDQNSYDQIVDHLQSVMPEEGCGLLAGLGGIVRRVIPVDNVLRSQARFRMDPAQQVWAMHSIRDAGLELMGIYHSHPQGSGDLSSTDIKESAYPEAAYLILWPEGDHWDVRCYSLVDGKSTLIDLIRI
jgi:proteasome lid subunit RPN8/RPN11